MLSENQIEQLTERLVNRIEKANIYFLEEIGKSIKKIGKLSPTKAQQLVQILKYGGNYQEIVNKIAQLTNLNIKEIDEIFYQFAKQDQQFYKKFYDYRNKPFIPINENEVLRSQVLSFANITKREMANFMNTRALGYSIKDSDGVIRFYGLQDTYNRLLDEAILNVGQGKEDFNSAMSRIMKEIGGSGLKTLDFASGRSIRLDSMARQHLQSALRNLHNEMQEEFGKDFDSDGIEISVHLNPAPDHAEAQGRQFSDEEYKKLQEIGIAKDYRERAINIHAELKSGETPYFRPISEYNCYHYIFPIILGVSKPNYTDEQLQEIIDNNNKGFELDGKHYTMYEGTQLQRSLERRIRGQKDIQILAKASGNEELAMESQYKLNQLTQKYKELSDVSSLPTKKDRLKISGYRKISTKPLEEKISLLYNKGTAEENANLYFRAKNRQQKILNGNYNLNIRVGKQEQHNINSSSYIEGKSYFTLSLKEEQELVNKYAGRGYIPATENLELSNKEICTTNKIIGKYINKHFGTERDTNSFIIHYSKKGVHIVPADYREVDKNE